MQIVWQFLSNSADSWKYFPYLRKKKKNESSSFPLYMYNNLGSTSIYVSATIDYKSIARLADVCWHWTVTRLFPFFPTYHNGGRFSEILIKRKLFNIYINRLILL